MSFSGAEFRILTPRRRVTGFFIVGTYKVAPYQGRVTAMGVLPKMKRLSLGVGIVLAILAISPPSRSAPDDKSNSLSDFTKQLVELMGLWSKLN
jgi:hypothetical protein